MNFSFSTKKVDRSPERLRLIRNQPRLCRPVLAGAVLALLSACAAQSPPLQQTQDFRGAVAAGDFATAVNAAAPLAGPADKPELLWTLNTGAAALHQPDPGRTIAALDAAENLMSQVEGANFTFDTSYRFGSYDAAMVNTYKALANLARGDRDGARVEMNRAEERLARIAQRYTADIASGRDNIAQKQRDDANTAQALTNAGNSSELQELQRSLADYGAFQPFLSPASTYLRGIYLLNSGAPGDAEQARDAFRRVQGIANNPSVVAQDLAAATQAARGRRPAPQVWVIFENGQSPEFEQLNFTVPMPVLGASGQVSVSPVTVSIPRLAFRPNAYQSLTVTGQGAAVQTVTVASMRAVMASEYRARYDNLVAGAVVEALVKAVGVSAANAASSRMGQGGALLRMAAVGAANVTTSDTRSWQVLPAEFQAARVPTPASGKVQIAAPGGSGMIVDVPPGKSAIILVKAQTPGSPLRAQVLPL